MLRSFHFEAWKEFSSLCVHTCLPSRGSTIRYKYAEIIASSLKTRLNLLTVNGDNFFVSVLLPRRKYSSFTPYVFYNQNNSNSISNFSAWFLLVILFGAVAYLTALLCAFVWMNRERDLLSNFVWSLLSRLSIRLELVVNMLG